ncbi:unnamed protein product [Penicillium egyptiacum]|uniref:Uncharacterized protein n=1 Tax=Penicillium egyptiacum TaxID=1303716 RepID=A0A9W4P987_9EURO|nr:unnamed protein product [Penicillium egyptiacum]
MLLLVLLFSLANHSLASNSTTLVGWQLADNTRSTWDILWTCLSTILACTWTVLHMDVGPRNQSDWRFMVDRARLWLYNILIPERIAGADVAEFFAARGLRATCNKTQAAKDSEISMSKIWLPVRTRPIEHSAADIELQPLNTEWTFAHCFCLIMGGIALQTEDGWIYSVGWEDIQLLIQAGVIRCSDIRDRDIEDRSKADWFAKGFTVFQSTWFLVNVIARLADDLPVSPVELTTVAYVICGILTYGFWWCKPKDMATPVIVPLRCNGQDMQADIEHVADAKPEKWVHLQTCLRKNSAISALSELYHERKLLDTPLASTTWLNEEMARQEQQFSSIKIIGDVVGSIVALSFCAVHLAAWNFTFPTEAEQTSWRVFTIVSVASIFIYYLLMTIQDVCMWLRCKDMLPSFLIGFDSHDDLWRLFKDTILNISMAVYLISRFGIVALVSSSLRLLPVGSYRAIQWATSIPYF